MAIYIQVSHLAAMCKQLGVRALLCMLTFLYGCDSNQAREIGSIVVVDFRSEQASLVFRTALFDRIVSRFGKPHALKIDFVSCPFGKRAPEECATEALAKRPALVYATSTTIARAIRDKNSEVPIVFSGIFDPRRLELVDSLNRPGKHITGFVSFADAGAKRLELLKAVNPNIKVVGVLGADAYGGVTGNQLSAEKELELQTVRVDFPDPTTVEALNKIVCDRRFDAFDVPTTAALRESYPLLITALKRCPKPAIFIHSDFVERGGLMSYAPRDFDYADKAAEYLLRASQSSDLGDIPVETPTVFVMAWNKTTARLLSPPPPNHVLLRVTTFYE